MIALALAARLVAAYDLDQAREGAYESRPAWLARHQEVVGYTTITTVDNFQSISGLSEDIG